MNPHAHFYYSKLRESIIEHVFIGEALRAFWRRGVFDVEVLHSEFDVFGYDLMISRDRIVRHVQLKTGTAKRPSKVLVSLSLASKPSGCVVWIHTTPELDLGPYFWYGDQPGQPLPGISHYRIPRRTTHNKQGLRPERANHREVPGTAFKMLQTLPDVLDALFGPPR